MDWQKCISELQEKGLAVDQIAEAIGVTGNAVREVIAGRTKSPRANAALLLLKLCEEHGVGECAAPAAAAEGPATRSLNTPEAVARFLGVSRETAEPPPSDPAAADPEPEVPGDSRVVPFEAPP